MITGWGPRRLPDECMQVEGRLGDNCRVAVNTEKAYEYTPLGICRLVEPLFVRGLNEAVNGMGGYWEEGSSLAARGLGWWACGTLGLELLWRNEILMEG